MVLYLPAVHANLIIYRSLKGIWCLSPPKMYMKPCESTQAEWPSLGAGLLPSTRSVYLGSCVVILCLFLGKSLLLTSNESSAFLIMKVFFMLTEVGEVRRGFASESPLSFFEDCMFLGMVESIVLLVGERLVMLLPPIVFLRLRVALLVSAAATS